jgi:hypothetical protein
MDDQLKRWSLLGVAVGLATLIGSILWKRSSGAESPGLVMPESDPTSEPSPEPVAGKVDEPEQKEDKSSASPFLETIGAVFSPEGILVPTVVLGAIGYFLGWRYLFSYYGSFGLDTSLFSFSPTEVISAGWRIYLVIAVLVLWGAGLLMLGNYLSKYLARKEKSHYLLAAFFVTTVVAALLLGYVVYQFVFVWGAHSTLWFYVWAFAALSFLWVLVVLGVNISAAHGADKEDARTLPAAFRVVFASPSLWLGILGLGLVVVLAWFASWLALRASVRDRSDESRLPIASFYVSEELGIPDGHLVQDGVWLYDDLRLVLKSDDTYFAFDPSQVRNDIATVYGIPQEYVMAAWLRNWYDKVANP